MRKVAHLSAHGKGCTSKGNPKEPVLGNLHKDKIDKKKQVDMDNKCTHVQQEMKCEQKTFSTEL